MDITKQDQNILDQLNLGNIPEEDKKAVLEMIDERLEKRFLANLLLSLPEDKQKELETRVETMEDEDAEKIIETILELHPDAKGVLERSAKEIIEELKRDGRSSEDGRSSVVGGQSSENSLSSVVSGRLSEDSQSATNSQQPATSDQRLTTNNQPPTISDQPLTTNDQPLTTSDQPSPPPIP